MNYNLYWFLILMFSTSVTLASESVLRLIVVPAEYQRVLGSCDIRDAKILNNKGIEYVSIELTTIGMNKAYKLLKTNKGKPIMLTFGDDLLLNLTIANFPQIPRALVIESNTRDKEWSKRIIADLKKVISRCGTSI